jgi:hypothetical protein
MAQHKFPQKQLKLLQAHQDAVFKNLAEWSQHLEAIDLTKAAHVRTATEGALKLLIKHLHA